MKANDEHKKGAINNIIKGSKPWTKKTKVANPGPTTRQQKMDNKRRTKPMEIKKKKDSKPWTKRQASKQQTTYEEKSIENPKLEPTRNTILQPWSRGS